MTEPDIAQPAKTLGKRNVPSGEERGETDVFAGYPETIPTPGSGSFRGLRFMMRFMTFSSHIEMIYKNSALQDISVKLLFIEYRLSKKIPLI